MERILPFQGKDSGSIPGAPTRQSNSTYKLKQYYIRKRLFIDRLGGKCKKCGSTENLEFDHIDPKNKCFTIGNKLVSRSIRHIEIELKKCQLLCNPCHKEKNKKDNGEAKHGTYYMYRRYKCRCIECKEAERKQRRNWKVKTWA